MESTASKTEKKSFCLTLFMARHVLLTKSKISLHHHRCCVLIFMPQKSPRKNVKLIFFLNFIHKKKNTNKAIENAMKNYGFLETTESDFELRLFSFIWRKKRKKWERKERRKNVNFFVASNLSIRRTTTTRFYVILSRDMQINVLINNLLILQN